MSYVIVAGRLLFAGIFVLSLLGKTRGRAVYRQFVTATADLLTVGGTAVHVLAAATVGAETAIVVLVLLPVSPVAGFGLVAGLLVCYTVALVCARRRADRVACHCFGASSAPVGRRHVVRNLALIGVVILLIAATLVAPAGPVEPGGVAVAALAAIPFTLAVAHLDDLVDVLRSPNRK